MKLAHLLFFGLVNSLSTMACSARPTFVVEELAQNLGIVWGMVFINKEELLFTEREGKIKILHIPTGKVCTVPGAPAVYAKGQGGLLDVTLHPRFSQNKTIYLSYSKVKGQKQSTAVVRAVLKSSASGAGSACPKIVRMRDIFTAQPFVDSSRHFGSRLLFDKKGFLYVTVGDRANRHMAQKLDNHTGKILRLTDKGKAPKDNPFVSHSGALPETWSYGHRNPQGLFIHRETGQLYAQEHGPRGGDEINLIKKGKNYGWPVITYGKEYWGPKIGEGKVKKGMEQPVYHYTPSIAPSGLLIYSGKKFPHWKNSFFSGALVLRHLNRLELPSLFPNNSRQQKGQSRQPTDNSHQQKGQSRKPTDNSRKPTDNSHQQKGQRGKRAISSQQTFPLKGKEERLLQDLNFRVRHVLEGPEAYIYLAVDRGKILRLIPAKEKRSKKKQAI